MMLFVCLVCSILFVPHYAQTPPQLIDRVVKTIFEKDDSNCRLYQYQYGGAITFDAMYKATAQFGSDEKNYNTSQKLDYNSNVLQILNYYLYNDSSTPGYKIVHGQTIPWSSDGAIGDTIGLFPITYLDSLLYEYKRNNDAQVFNFKGKNKTQWQLIFTTMDYYILQFPRRLTDKYGTVSRSSAGSWKDETNKNNSFLWGDDNFMGLTLPARLAQVLTFCETNVANSCNGVNVENNITTYTRFVYEQNMGFAQHLPYPNSRYNGLYAHGYNFASNDHSCCPWGRANAWVMIAHVEALKMYKYLNDSAYENDRKDILQIYQNQVNEVGSLQNGQNGRWHQVINDTSTYLETSCSTGFLYGMIYGRMNALLPTNVYSLSDWDNKIELGWKGLLDIVDFETGIISGACEGTGIQNDVEAYNSRSTAYCSCGNPGDPAFVLNAIIGYQQYLNFKNP